MIKCTFVIDWQGNGMKHEKELFFLRNNFSCGSASKESARNVGDLGLIPGLGRSSGEGNSNPFQYSGLENSMDRGLIPYETLGHLITVI